MRLKKSVKIIIILLFILITSTIIIKDKYFNNKESNMNKTNIIKKETEKKNEEKISLIAGGDVIIHESLLNDAFIGNDNYDFSHMFQKITPILKNYDIAYCNQETVFGGNNFKYSGYPTFNTPSSLGSALIKSGFNLISLATNHSMDKGMNGALNSALWWEEQNIYSAGMSSSKEKREKIKVNEINKIKYAMLSYTFGTNGIPIPEGHEYLVNLYSDDRAKKDIEIIKDKVDLLIVAMHWGSEYSHKPNEYQKRVANYLNSLGVNLILGNHTHAIEPIEYINDTLVIYSMGNLISNQMDPVVTVNHGLKGVIGSLVSMDIKKEKDKIKFENINVLLHFTSKINGGYKIIPFNDIDYENIPEYIKNYESVFNEYKKIVDSDILNVINIK